MIFHKMLQLTGSFGVVLVILVTGFVCEASDNVFTNKKDSHSYDSATHSIEIFNATEKTHTRNKTRHFDWQKKYGDAQAVEETETEMAQIMEMTSSPIIKEYPTSKVVVGPRKEDFPEMEISEIKSAEQVGDVHLILWGAGDGAMTNLTNGDSGLDQVNKTNEDKASINIKIDEKPSILATTHSTADSEIPSTANYNLNSNKDSNIATPADLNVSSTGGNPFASTNAYITTTTLQSVILSATAEPPRLFIPSTQPIIATTQLESVVVNSSITPEPTSMDSMQVIDEDMIRTYTLNNKEQYGRGYAKPKYITIELEKMNFTHYDETKDGPKSIDFLHIEAPQIQNSTEVMKMHREMSVSVVSRKK